MNISRNRNGEALAYFSVFVALLRRFRRERGGAVAIIYALTAFATTVMVGGAVDFGRWLHARQQTLAAIDAAVLSAARSLLTSGQDTATALRLAQQFYLENARDRMPLLEDTISFTINESRTEVSATGRATMGTTLLGLIGIDRLELVNVAGAEFATASIQQAGAANGKPQIELSMMLDVTGSMAGQKLADLKAAAKDLVEIVVLDGAASGDARIALVPFSSAVRAGELVPQVAANAAATARFKFSDNRQRVWRLASDCVSERTGAQAFTDAAPTGTDKVGRVYSADGACSPANPVIPLTTNKALLHATIDNFVAEGGTAGHLGTAWAWYTLSPHWASVFPPESRPKSYTLQQEKTASGMPMLRKIAVLMTDGEYNVQYCGGIPDANTPFSSSQKADCLAANGASTQQARALCKSMKQAGLLVYAVGFQLPASGEAVDTLRDHCASDRSTFYRVENGDQLRQAFRDIALKTRPITLVK